MKSVRMAASATGRKAVFGAAKTFKLIALPMVLFALVISAGCTPTRTGATLKALGGPGGKQARIVVVRDKDLTIVDSGWKIFLDGAVMGDLKTGTFVYRDRPAGPHKLVFSHPGDFSRASTHNFVAVSGRTYVFRLALNEKGSIVRSSSASGGLVGMLVASAISDAADGRGFYDFTLLEGETAKQTLVDIRMAE